MVSNCTNRNPEPPCPEGSEERMGARNSHICCYKTKQKTSKKNGCYWRRENSNRVFWSRHTTNLKEDLTFDDEVSYFSHRNANGFPKSWSQIKILECEKGESCATRSPNTPCSTRNPAPPCKVGFEEGTRTLKNGTTRTCCYVIKKTENIHKRQSRRRRKGKGK